MRTYEAVRSVIIKIFVCFNCQGEQINLNDYVLQPSERTDFKQLLGSALEEGAS